MKIRTKILLPLTGTMLLAAAVSALIGIVALGGEARYNQIVEASFAATTATADVEKTFEAGTEFVREITAMTSFVNGEEISLRFQELDKSIASALNQIATHTLSEQHSNAISSASTAYAEWRSGARVLLGLVSAREIPTDGHVTQLENAARAAFQDLRDTVVETANAVVAAESVALRQQVRLILLSGLAAAIVWIGIVILVAQRISLPVSSLNQVMRRLASGETHLTIPHTSNTDEIGEMARTVDVFRQGLQRAAALEQQSSDQTAQLEQARIAKEQHERRQVDLINQATGQIAQGLARLASGDLSFQLTEPFAPAFEALRHDFNQSVQQLDATLGRISMSIATVENGTREIYDGADDLSKRTEQQALSLEETATALDEITANVTSSTRRTEEARSVAARANQSAADSVEVVARAEEAMRRIEDSSQQIAAIIGVIDEIALQTNLLSLNAGVEAARAGDAGKGFAVVAQEVRALAQRSAQAAKQIKNLIHNSCSEVDYGVKSVRDTGQALKIIGAFIGEINTHIESIAASAREQSVGLAEVNSAVNSMDHATQQNAAMVEQSNAASRSLAQEAATLRELVSQFHFDGLASRESSDAMTASAATLQSHAPSSAEPGKTCNLTQISSGRATQHGHQGYLRAG